MTGRPETPRPGQPARGTTSGQPLMVLFDLLGRRWAISVLWALRDGPRTFRELQDEIGVGSAGSLNTRLRELREVQLVTRLEAGYGLTDDGQALISVGEPLADWARDWGKRVADLEG